MRTGSRTAVLVSLMLLPFSGHTQTIVLPDLLAIEAPAETTSLALDDSIVTELLIDQASAGGATLTIDVPGSALTIGPNEITWTAENPPGTTVATRTEYVYLLQHGQTPVATARGPVTKGPAYATAGNHGANVVRDSDGGIHVSWRDKTPDVMYRYGVQDTDTGLITWNGAAVDISDGTATSRSYVAMATTANAVHFAWSGTGDQVRYRRLVRDGAEWSFDPVRATGAFGDSSDNAPDIAAYDDDEVHVLSRDMEYSYSRDGGLNWNAEDLNGKLPPGNTGIKYPALAVDQRGHVHMLVTTKFSGSYWPLWYLHRERPTAVGPGAWLEEHNPFAAKPAWQDPGTGGQSLLLDWADIEADELGNLHIGWHGTFHSGEFGEDDAFYATRAFADDGDPMGWQDPLTLMNHDPGTFFFSFTPSLATDAVSDTVVAVIMTKALGQAPFDSYDDLDSALRILRGGSFIDATLLGSGGYVPLSEAAGWPMSTWWPTAAPRLYRNASGRVWLDVLQSMHHLVSSDDFALIVHQRYEVTDVVDTQIDTDLDGVPDILDDFPLDPDEWLDTDGDGVGDNADDDDDDDGFSDSFELQYSGAPYFMDPLVDSGARPDDDADVDGVTLITEISNGSSDTSFDTDGDGLTDYHEVNVSGTNPGATTTVTTGPPPVAGDADQDGDVDVSDLLRLQQILSDPVD